jgi:phosphatidylethanolamine-binding protein (PEBP) family uncharacterized protein
MLPLILALTLTSPDVRDGAPVPRPYVWNRDCCDGANLAPRLGAATTIEAYRARVRGHVLASARMTPVYKR